jgi:PTH1 family peptidyl-tRNA hydrolase
MESLREMLEAIHSKTRQEKSDLTATPAISLMIVGLGNPGREYRDTRHNIGFMVVDHLAAHLNANFSRMESKALVTKADYHGKRLLLVKPQTFMNLSGQAVSALRKFYKLPMDRLLVIYDDVDLSFGSMRLRAEGGSAGHKGMISIIENLGTQAFPRLRLGVGRPPGRKAAADYVLEPFSKSELEILPGIIDKGLEAVLVYCSDGISAAMNQYNQVGS